MKSVVEMMNAGLCHKLCMMGIAVDERTFVKTDKILAIHNCSNPASQLKKKLATPLPTTLLGSTVQLGCVGSLASQPRTTWLTCSPSLSLGRCPVKLLAGKVLH